MAATNLNIQMDSEVKNRAQQYFDQMGLDMAAGINMLVLRAINGYNHQSIQKPLSLDEMSIEQLDAEIDRGFADFEAGRYRPAKEVFDELKQRHRQRFGG